MPCALTSNADYPDYLKSILKEIDAGSDDELKDCACDLKSPVNDEGCLIVDENNKIGAFPFCSTLVTSESEVGDDTDYPLKLTLKQAMNLYWQTKKWKFNASANSYSCGACINANFTESKKESVKFVNLGDVDPPPPQKNLVCRNYFQYLTDWKEQYCGPFPPGTVEDVIIGSMFESSNCPMKYKKEGSIYYFYPYFSLSVGLYAVCASPTKTSAITCTNSVMGTVDVGPELSVTVKILKEECLPLKMYTKAFGPSTDEFGCKDYGGSVSISTLEFTK